MKKFLSNYKEVLLTLAVFAIMLTPVFAGAQTPIDPPGRTPIGPPGTLPIGNQTASQGYKILSDPLGGKSVCGLVTGLLEAAMIIGIPIAILFIVWAGFKFVLAQGNSTKLEEARKNFLNVVIGIAIFVGASLIGSVIINTVRALGVTGINSC